MTSLQDGFKLWLFTVSISIMLSLVFSMGFLQITGLPWGIVWLGNYLTWLVAVFIWVPLIAVLTWAAHEWYEKKLSPRSPF